MTRLSVPLDQAIAAKQRARRQAIRFPLWNRWLAVKLRAKVHLADMWNDLVYLVRG